MIIQALGNPYSGNKQQVPQATGKGSRTIQPLSVPQNYPERFDVKQRQLEEQKKAAQGPSIFDKAGGFIANAVTNVGRAVGLAPQPVVSPLPGPQQYLPSVIGNALYEFAKSPGPQMFGREMNKLSKYGLFTPAPAGDVEKEANPPQDTKGWFQKVNQYSSQFWNGVYSGFTGGIFKSQIETKTVPEKVAKTTGEVIGAGAMINNIKTIFNGLVTQSAPVVKVLSQYPTAAKYIVPILENVVGFDVYGQLDPQQKNRLQKLAVDTGLGLATSGLGFIRNAPLSVVTNFGLGYGISKASGLSDEDAVINGAVLAFLDAGNRTQEALLRAEISATGERIMNPEEARNMVLNSKLANTPLGKKIIKNSFEAEQVGGNVRIYGAKQGPTGIAEALGSQKPRMGTFDSEVVPANQAITAPAEGETAITKTPTGLGPLAQQVPQYKSSNEFAVAILSKPLTEAVTKALSKFSGKTIEDKLKNFYNSIVKKPASTASTQPAAAEGEGAIAQAPAAPVTAIDNSLVGKTFPLETTMIDSQTGQPTPIKDTIKITAVENGMVKYKSVVTTALGSISSATFRRDVLKEPAQQAVKERAVPEGVSKNVGNYVSAADFAQGEFSAKPTDRVGRLDARTITARDSIDESAVKNYIRMIQTGQYIEPIELTREGNKLITLDGSHRLTAYQKTNTPALVIFRGKNPPAGLKTIQEVYNEKKGAPAEKPQAAKPSPGREKVKAPEKEPEKPAPKPIEERRKEAEDYINKKGIKLREEDTSQELVYKPGVKTNPLTTKFLEHPDIKGKDFTSYSYLYNLSKSTSVAIKQIERDIVQNVLNTQFKDQSKINLDDFRNAVISEMLPLDVIYSDTYSDYGADNIGAYSLDNHTYILNSPFVHGKTGHFGGDFFKSTPREDLEIKEIPVQQQNPREKFAVIRKGVTLTRENIEQNVFTVTPTRELAQKWIDGHTLTPEEIAKARSDSDASKALVRYNQPGLFAHFRTFDYKPAIREGLKGAAGYSNVAEIQSDVFQHGIEDIGTGAEMALLEEAVSRNENSRSEYIKDLEYEESRLTRLKKLRSLLSDKTFTKEAVEMAREVFPYSDIRPKFIAKYGLEEEDIRLLRTNFIENNLEIERINVILDGIINRQEERVHDKRVRFAISDTKFDEQKAKLAEMQKNPPKVPPEETLFKSYKNIWHERVIREAIYLKANEGFEAIRFPTPRTIAVIEGYTSGGEGDNLMPYETQDGSTDDLSPGDVIDYGGDEYTVISADSYEIVVAPTEKVTHFDADEAMQEDINSQWEDTKSEFEDLQKDFGEITTPNEAQAVVDAIEVYNKQQQYLHREKDAEREMGYILEGTKMKDLVRENKNAQEDVKKYRDFIDLIRSGVLQKEKVDYDKIHDTNFKDKLEKKYGFGHGMWNYFIDEFVPEEMKNIFYKEIADRVIKEHLEPIKLRESIRADETKTQIDQLIDEANQRKADTLARKPADKKAFSQLPKALQQQVKTADYQYSLNWGTEKVLNKMAGFGDETIAIDDFYDGFYEDLADGYDGDYEGIYGPGHVFYEENGNSTEVWTTEVDPEIFNQPSEYDQVSSIQDFSIDSFDGAQKTVLQFYDKQVIPYLQKIRRGNLELVTDDNDYQWYETKVTEKDLEPPAAYRIKDDMAKVGIKITDAQEKEIIELNAKIFGDMNVRITGQILANHNALGSYEDQIIKILDKQVNPKDTFYHEAVHKYMDAFMDREEHINLLLEAQDLYGIDDLKQVEERLAEDFITYAKNREGLLGKIRRFFDKLFERIRRYFQNKKTIDDVYNDILSGKARQEVEERAMKIEDIKPAENIGDYKSRIEQLNKVAQLSAIVRRTRIMKRALGRFEPPSPKRGMLPKEGTIALHGKAIVSDQEYMETLAHELGHALEFQITGATNKRTLDVFGETLDQNTREKILAELKAVTLDLVGAPEVAARPQYYHRQTEMLARFFEKMFAAPGNLTEIAPTASHYFELQAVKHPQLMDFLQATQDAIDKGSHRFKFLPDLRQTYQRVLGDRVGNIAYDEEVVYRAMRERGKIVIENFIKNKFKGIRDKPDVLFQAAEGIKVTRGGKPEFGTRNFQVAKNDAEELALQEAGWEPVGTDLVDGESYPLYAKARYTPKEAERIYNQLSPAGKQLINDFTAERAEAKDYFNREIIKDMAGIQSNLEGWVHHFFEDYEGKGTTVGKGLRFKLKKAGTRKQRKGAEGFVEDFKKATLKALTELEGEKVYNDFISRQFARVTKVIPEGKDPDKNWVEVMGNIKRGVGARQETKMMVLKDGKMVAIKQPRYQMPKEIYERYKLWKGLADEATLSVKIINDINRYWRVNILAHAGTATTNFISGGLQFGSKVLTDFYTETLTGNVGYQKTRRDIASMLQVLLPKGWIEGAPDWIYGSDLSNWYGQFTKQQGVLGKGIDGYADKALKLFSAYERYWKKVILLSEDARTLKGLNQMGKDGLRLPTQEERELIALINREVDLFAYDYDNVPLWLEAHQRSTLGQIIKPFAKYPYKYAKHITNLAGAVFDGSQHWKVRLAKLLSLVTMVGLYAWIAGERRKRQQTPAGTAETPARISPRGRLFIGTDAEGNEIFVRTAKYPFLNLTDLGFQLIDGQYEDAVNLVSDMIGTISPIATIGLLAMGYKNQYELYDEPGVVIGNAVSSYLPVGRVMDDISRMLDPYQRKQTSAYQTFTKYIPTTDTALQEKLHGKIRTVDVPIEGSIKGKPGEKKTRTTTTEVLKNYWQDILISMLTGIYIRRIDPEEAKAFLIRQEENQAKREKEAQKKK